MFPIFGRSGMRDPRFKPLHNNDGSHQAKVPDVTFTHTLNGPLAVDSRIICIGTPSADFPRFAINIGCGEPDTGRGDIAVHFNPRMPQGRVVRNTYRKGQWGNEELEAYRSFNFKVGQPFTIEIEVKDTETLWRVNGKLYCCYAHRNPSPFVAEWVQVTGIRDATLKVLPPPPLETPPEQSQSVIFTQLLNEPLAVGSSIICTGTPSADLPRFVLNIGCGEPGRGDIAAHFNPRLPERCVVRNTYLQGQWGLEEIDSNRPFPFQVGRPFTIEGVIQETETLWTVDGELYCSYAHRKPNPFFAEWIQTTYIRDATLKIQNIHNMSQSMLRRL